MATYSTNVSNRVTQAMFERLHSNEGVSDGDYIRAYTIYAGEQPSADTVALNWSTYNSSSADFLAHNTSGITLSHNTGTNTYYSTGPGSVTPVHNGTATWAILWVGGAVSDLQASLATLPQDRFVVVPVSDTSGIGVLRFQTGTNLVSTVTRSLYDAGFSLVNNT